MLALVGVAVVRVNDTTLGGVRSIVYVSPPVKLPLLFPVPPRGVVPFVMESLSVRSRRSVPLPLPVLTATVYVIPLPLTFAIEAPVTPLVVSEKSEESTPVTDCVNVTV